MKTIINDLRAIDIKNGDKIQGTNMQKNRENRNLSTRYISYCKKRKPL